MYGIERFRHHSSYDILFSKNFLCESAFNLDKYCYYFESQKFNSNKLEMLYQYYTFQVNYWQQLHRNKRQIILTFDVDYNRLEFIDNRFSEKSIETIYTDAIYAELYQYMYGKLLSTNALYDRFACYPKTLIDAAILDFQHNRFVYIESNKIVALAFPKYIYERK